MAIELTQTGMGKKMPPFLAHVVDLRRFEDVRRRVRKGIRVRKWKVET